VTGCKVILLLCSIRKDKKMHKTFNPYLPSYEYIPDGEPHVFGDRVYIYGSHDRFHGAEFCLNDYICYSADVRDLSEWRYEGIIYKKEQDPRNQNIPANAPAPEPGFCADKENLMDGDLNSPGIHALFAPDVVQGPDKRFYLFYCLDYLNGIGVAVCNEPAGEYVFLDFVRHKDGSILGEREGDLWQFDPGIFVDVDDTVYLYSGNGPVSKEQKNRHSISSQVMKLEDDMVTIKEEPERLLPGILESEGTGFEGHEFFEASSIRRIHNKYYLVYSSVRSHELCYAISDQPDKGYQFGGTLIDIGDVFLDGRTENETLNCLGNTHGGIECINGKWYVFYHRHSNRTNYSRQGCAEQIEIQEDGSIKQKEITSCGLNGGPLEGKGCYPAYICCQLTGKKSSNRFFSHPLAIKMKYPFLTRDIPDVNPSEEMDRMDRENPIQYIKNIAEDTVIGYKYFACKDISKVCLWVRGNAAGDMKVLCRPMKSENDKEENKTEQGYQSYEDTMRECGSVEINLQDGEGWQTAFGTLNIPQGVHALYFAYHGEGSLSFRKFELI